MTDVGEAPVTFIPAQCDWPLWAPHSADSGGAFGLDRAMVGFGVARSWGGGQPRHLAGTTFLSIRLRSQYRYISSVSMTSVNPA
jgi:hypothetical protein